MNNPMMKCGHTANAVDQHGNPVCIICMCTEIQEEKPSLEGRMAKCSDCGNITTSDWNLPFFKYCPDKEYDEYYDGCFGWD